MNHDVFQQTDLVEEISTDTDTVKYNYFHRVQVERIYLGLCPVLCSGCSGCAVGLVIYSRVKWLPSVCKVLHLSPSTAEREKEYSYI